MDNEREITEEGKNQSQELNTISTASEHQEESTQEVTSTDEKQEEQPQTTDEQEDSVKSEKVEVDKFETQTNDKATEKVVASEKVEEVTKVTSEEKQSEQPNNKEEVIEKEAEKANTIDEEVQLTSQEDLDDKHDDHHDNEEDEEHEEVDYSTFSKAELVEKVKEAGHMENVVKADKILYAIKPFFDEFRQKERDEALEKFVAGGGEKDDFEYRNDELNTRFDANYRLIKDKKSKFFQEREKQKDQNLIKKQEVLEKLREFVDSDETNMSFDDFKALQNEWRSIGQVPIAYNKTLWANYNALLDRFYDKRSIYFELKELDRKKNLEAKLELCVKAEELVNEKQLKVAIQHLNELHEEFKHLGPVPKKEQEPLWQRFKTASDAVYEKRKEYVEVMKGELEENLVKKSQLSDLVKEYTKFNSDRIKEWNEKTKELLALQKQWEAIGGLPREKGKEVNKKFWSGFKLFFHNKGEFFKRLDQERGGNLKLKEELVEKAVALKNETDWIKTANEYKKLQRSWKEIGPVPEKHRNEIYKRFKEACDHFFDQKRAHNDEASKEYDENLKKKEAICEQIQRLSGDESSNLEQLRELQGAFNDIGFVPKNEIGEIKSKYADAVDKFINSIPSITNEERHQIRVENQINKMMNEPNSGQKIFRKEQAIRKHIGQIENDIALWKNNMEFFAASKTADKLRDEFEEKIDKAAKELKQLKQELRLLRSV